jgi:DNA ligase (NAD+)|tara:strand:+ start:144 stop:386 length:243 start_codon:yes stop_codon:yes gene_type:complete
MLKNNCEKMLQKSKEFLKKDKNSFSLADTRELQELIQYHSDLYYNKEEPIISDYEYDVLFETLQFLENKYEIESKQTDQV